MAAVPAVRYALGIAGIAAAIAIVGSFKLGLAVAALGTIVMLGLMTALLVFARLAGAGTTGPSGEPSILEGPAYLMVWVFTLLTCATGVMVFSVTFFGFPKTWHDIFPDNANPGALISVDTMSVDPSGVDTIGVDTARRAVSDSLRKDQYGNPEGCLQLIRRRIPAAVYVEGPLSDAHLQDCLYNAAAEGDARTVLRVLAQGRASPNFADDFFTPLGIAVQMNRIDAARVLLTHGATPDEAGPGRRPPSVTAAGEGSIRLLEELLKAGADANARNIDPPRWTPIFYAASRGDRRMIELLLRHGAARTARSSEGKLPEDVARENGHADVVGLLVSNGTEKGQNASDPTRLIPRGNP